MRNKEFTLNDQQLLEEIMLHRRDVRGNNFLKENVSDDVLKKILLAGSLAPSVGFSQPWEFVIIRDIETKKRISEIFETENKKAEQLFYDEKRAMYGKLKLEGILEAPVNIAVFYKPSSAPVLGQTTMAETGEYSVVCAIQNMWLMSRVLNVGLGWVSILDRASVQQTLKSPPDNKLVAYLCLGYVDKFFETPELETLNWEKRRPIHSVIYHDNYENSVKKSNG